MIQPRTVVESPHTRIAFECTSAESDGALPPLRGDLPGRAAAPSHAHPRLTDGEPNGVDLVLDGGGPMIGTYIGALRPRGRLVAYGFMAAKGSLATLAMFVNLLVGSRLRRRRGSFYGITALYRRDPTAFREDLPKVFALLASKQIDPMIARTLPLLDARKALELLATGSVEGKIVPPSCDRLRTVPRDPRHAPAAKASWGLPCVHTFLMSR